MVSFESASLPASGSPSTIRWAFGQRERKVLGKRRLEAENKYRPWQGWHTDSITGETGLSQKTPFFSSPTLSALDVGWASDQSPITWGRRS